MALKDMERGRTNRGLGATPNLARALLGIGAAITFGCAPASGEGGMEAPAPSQGTFSTPTVLASAGESPRAYGLTGVNKPNGAVYRFRESLPPHTPSFMPRQRDGLDLKIADPAGDGWLAFYKGALPEPPRNADYHAVMYGRDGEQRWELDLNRFLATDTHLEIQDIRWADGQLYFNEACQSHSREAGGQCSALLRVDPESGRVVWRTKSLVSNNIFLVHGPYIIAGYGFTAEPDALHLVSRATGRVVDTLPIESAHSYLEFKDGRLHVLTYDGAFTVAIQDD